MGNIFYFEWENQLIQAMQSLGGEWFVKFGSFVTALGGEIVLVAILGLIYWGMNKEMGRYILTTLSLVLVFPAILKNLVCRIRPYMVTDSIKCLSSVGSGDIMDVKVQGYAFPSMHTANAVAFYGTVPYYLGKHGKKNKLLWAIGIVLPIFIGLSRMYVGVHYPTDVLCGYIFGVVSIIIVDLAYRNMKNIYVFYVAVLILGLPGMFICKSNDYFTCYGIIAGAYAGFVFENEKVNFECPKAVWKKILVTVVGLLLFLAVTNIMKLPFSEEFLESGSKACMLFRSVRYGIGSFVVLGLYPMLFKYIQEK